MEVRECLWLDEFVDKLIRKHHVSPEEVEQVFANRPDVRKVEDGDVKGEDLYTAFGRTQAGRYLSLFFIAKLDKRALVISARDMSRQKENAMAKENNLHFDSYEEAAEWFETNDMADYEDRLTPIEFYFDLRKDRDWVELEHDLARQLRQVAKERGLSTRALVNQWLYERVNQ